METNSIETQNPFQFTKSSLQALPENLVNIPHYKEPFIDAILLVKNAFKHIVEAIQEPQADGNTAKSELFTTIPNLTSIDPGTLHFGMFLYAIDRMKEEGTLLPMIKQRRDEIEAQKEHWRPFIDALQKGDDQSFYADIKTVLTEGKILANNAGCGSAYFLINSQGQPRYVIKPVDEDIFCLNNRKEFGSVFNDTEHRVRDDIPLYRSAQTDAICSEIAILSGLEGATPKAIMGIFQDQKFYDFTVWIPEVDRESFISMTGIPDKEKLCSIQEFIPNSQDLVELLHAFYAEGLSDEEIRTRFDQEDFEQVCMFLWLTYDNDGHGGNFRTYVKRTDENGKKIYGIKKIDNGLSLPEKNTNYINILTWVPNAAAPISDSLKQKIANLPIEKILERMDTYELSTSKDAFIERIEILKRLSSREGITIAEIDLRLGFLAMENGKDLALNTMTTDQIIEFFGKDKTKETTSLPSIKGGTNEAA